MQRTLGHFACGIATIALAWAIGILHSTPPPVAVTDSRPIESAKTGPPVSSSSVDACQLSPFSLADLNLDFSLDDEDWRLMKGAKDSRFKDARYLPRADILFNQVVTDEDENIFCDLFNEPNIPRYADHEFKCLCTRAHRDPGKSETVGEYLRRVIPEEK